MGYNLEVVDGNVFKKKRGVSYLHPHGTMEKWQRRL